METKPSQALIVAHRGGAKTKALENTLEAFKRAFTLEVDAIEGDFHLTSDNHIICHHDDTIQNLTIKNSTLVELQVLQPNLPTLKEVLSLIPIDKMIYIEIKCGIEIFEYLVPNIQNSNLLQSQIIIIAFDAEVIHQAKVTYPNIKAYWLYELKEERMPRYEDMKNLLAISKADGLSTNVTLHTDEKFVKSLIDTGYSYHVWTYKTYPIDSLKKIDMLKAWGVASITLDAIDIVL